VGVHDELRGVVDQERACLAPIVGDLGQFTADAIGHLPLESGVYERVAEQLSQLVARTHDHLLDYAPSEQLYPWVDFHPHGRRCNIYSGVRVDPRR
jgi:hypothetical protein